MKNLRKLGGILLGLIGISALFTSCAKERQCNCTYGSGVYRYTIITKQKCDELNLILTDNTYAYLVTCTEF
ncbi:MAG: hypothetical protein HRT72_14145 [Flavobacteriales bacterium]|nr:hypothetical protein [Flavobacteriales bacterium]